MSRPLMPLATATWLIDNTSLSFSQIADFCNMHEMEIQSIADGELATNLEGQNPVFLGQLTEANIREAEKNPDVKLELLNPTSGYENKKNKQKVKYIPIAKRRDKPDAIAWLVKNYPDIPNNKIVKLIGTTKSTIESIRSRTHSNMMQIQPKDPVLLGLCKQSELDSLLELFKN